MSVIGFKIGSVTEQYNYPALDNKPVIDAVPTEGSTNAVQSGGVYDAIPTIDPTLTQSGQAADAFETGNKITSLKEDLNNALNDITISGNLYNPETDTIGKNIDASGNIVDNVSLKISDYIDIGVNTPFSLQTEKIYGDNTGARIFAQYDENKNFQVRTQCVDSSGWKSYTLSQTKYIRLIMGANTPPYMVNIGSSLLPYVAYGYHLIDDSEHMPNVYDAILNEANERQDVDEEIQDTVKRVLTISPNLYDPSKNNIGSISNDGSINTGNTKWMYSDFIYIGLGNKVCVKTAETYSGDDGATMVAYYDTNKNFITREQVSSTTYTHTMVGNQEYIRVQGNRNAPPYMVNLGNNLLPYVKYGTIWSDELEEYIESLVLQSKEKDYQFSSINIPSTGEVENVKAIDGTGDYDDNTTISQLYAAWDALKTQNPHYITKTDLGLDQSGTYHLYKYSFVPESINVLNNYVEHKNPPKILLGGGTHGNGEDAGDKPEMIFALLNLFQNICNNWRGNETLSYFRWHVNFEIIPLQNPWGFVNKSRRNSRLVDINRNFPYGWKLGTYGANDYGGPSALSEAESQIVSNFIANNDNAIAYVDIHTTGGIAEQDKMIYFSMIGTNDMYYIANDLVLQLSEKWNSENISGLNTSINFHGYISDSPTTGNGQINQYALKIYKIPSCIIEGFPNFQNSGVTTHSKTIMEMCSDELVNLILCILRFAKTRY